MHLYLLKYRFYYTLSYEWHHVKKKKKKSSLSTSSATQSLFLLLGQKQVVNNITSFSLSTNNLFYCITNQIWVYLSCLDRKITMYSFLTVTTNGT